MFDYSEADIVRKTGLPPRKVSIELKRLLEAGLIRLTRHLGKANMYMINTRSEQVQYLRKYYEATCDERAAAYGQDVISEQSIEFNCHDAKTENPPGSNTSNIKERNKQRD